MKSIETLKQSRGAVAPLVAIMLILIVVCVALVVDLGHVHNVKVELQRAVDAAALGAAQQLPDPDKTVDVAVAVGGTNTVDNITGLGGDGLPAWVTDAQFEVVLGRWDKEALGDPASVRFDADLEEGETPNAVKVTATRNVNHVFFFFDDDGTVVTADAIAVNQFEPLTIPISVVTCIPTGGGSYPGIFTPAQSICDIALFKFGSATSDTAGWTSLTIKVASNPTISKFFDGCGVDLFNRIVYGEENGQPGLESQNFIDRSLSGGPGCTIDENETIITGYNSYCDVPVNIACGLGGDYGEGFTDNVDPRLLDPLPHWYDEEGDAIRRIWSMEEILNPHLSELDADRVPTSDYFDRLEALHKASDLSDPYTFDNFIADFGSKIPPGHPILDPSSEWRTDERFTRYIDKNGPVYEPDFKAPLEESGYPEVSLIEGKADVIDALIKLTADEDSLEFKSSLRKENPPLDDGAFGAIGETVLVTLPVIFTGSCQQTAYNQTGLYVGTTNFLLTRLWETKQADKCYDNGDNAVTVSASCPEPPPVFGDDKKVNRVPPLVGSQLRSILGFDGKTFEGLLLKPTRGPEAETGIRKIFLVE